MTTGAVIGDGSGSCRCSGNGEAPGGRHDPDRVPRRTGFLPGAGESVSDDAPRAHSVERQEGPGFDGIAPGAFLVQTVQFRTPESEPNGSGSRQSDVGSMRRPVDLPSGSGTTLRAARRADCNQHGARPRRDIVRKACRGARLAAHRVRPAPTAVDSRARCVTEPCRPSVVPQAVDKSVGNHTVAIRTPAGHRSFSSAIPVAIMKPAADQHQAEDQVAVLGLAGQQPEVVRDDDEQAEQQQRRDRHARTRAGSAAPSSAAAACSETACSSTAGIERAILPAARPGPLAYVGPCRACS